jgi:hypothetical protein
MALKLPDVDPRLYRGGALIPVTTRPLMKAETNGHNNSQRPLTASVQRYTFDDRKGIDELAKTAMGQQAWQLLAWTLGRHWPLGYIMMFIGNALSRLRVVPAYDKGDGHGPEEDATNEQVNAVLADIERGIAPRGGLSGFPAFLGTIGRHLPLVGETFVHAYNDPDTLQNVYEVYSTSELRRSSSGMQHIAFPGVAPVDLAKLGGMLVRIWDPDPEWGKLSTSCTRHMFDDIEALRALEDALASSDLSRVGAGLYPLPAGAFLSDGRKGSDGLSEEAIEYFGEAVQNRRAVQRGMPLFFEADPAFLAALKERPIDLGRPGVETDIKRWLAYVEHLKESAPIPKETFEGKADMNHWSSYHVSADEYKACEPTGALGFSGLTQGIFRPMLGTTSIDFPAMAPNEIRKWSLIGDPTHLIQEPDMADISTKGLGMGTVSGAGWRAMNRIPEAYAPTPEELAQRAAFLHTRIGEKITEQPGSNPQALPLAAQATTASAAPNPTRMLGPKLAKLQSELGVKLEAGAAVIIDAAIKRVGSRIRGQMTPAQRNVWATTDNRQLAAKLHEAGVQQLGIDVEKIIHPMLMEFFAQAEQWVRQSWARAISDVGRSFGVVLNVIPDDDRIAETMAGLRHRVMSALLTKLWGRQPPGLTASVGLAPYQVHASFVADVLDAINGPLNEALGEDGEGPKVLEITYTWIHDDPGKPFPAHEALDGLEFTSMGDPALAVEAGDDWIGSDSYYPGDHDGCLCSVDMIVDWVSR